MANGYITGDSCELPDICLAISKQSLGLLVQAYGLISSWPEQAAP